MKGSEQSTCPRPNFFKDAIRAPLLRVLHLVSLSEPHLIGSASRMYGKIQQNLCANVPKGTPKHPVDKLQFKIKLISNDLQSEMIFIYNVK